MHFDLTPNDVPDYHTFVSADGWTIREYRNEGPTGLPVRFRFIGSCGTCFSTSPTFSVWFVALWLILRFQWMHAFLLALVMWVVDDVDFLADDARLCGRGGGGQAAVA